MTGPGAPSTVRDFALFGMSINVYCSNVWVCRNGHLFVMDELAGFTGWEFDIYARRGELLRRMRCRCCGTRHPDLRLSPPNGYGGRGSRGGPGNVGLAV